MCGKQIEICRDILIREIENYEPTHILFVTGWNYWFHSKVLGVDKLFDDCKFIAENNKKNKVYVEGTAVYRKNNLDIPVIVACRPETRCESEYIKSIVAAFPKKKEV